MPFIWFPLFRLFRHFSGLHALRSMLVRLARHGPYKGHLLWGQIFST
jgi:hypothetical protein